MCTAVSYRENGLYFGRNLDYEMSYGEEIVITPRNFRFDFKAYGACDRHYAMIGTAHTADGYPLYYDAVNEKGLCIAGLNFVRSASYSQNAHNCTAPFELIPLVLSKCADTEEARALLGEITLGDIPFSQRLPASKLHWILADKNKTVAAEPENGGLKVYDAPANVLANDPPFNYQMQNLNNYMALSPYPPENRFSEKLPLKAYSRGMGAMGLPGDLSSQSRFVRAAFVAANAVSGNGEYDGITQLFHILGSVEQQNGCCITENGGLEKTIYTACFDAQSGVYYYTTYENRQITAIDMFKANLNAAELACYPMINTPQIKFQNG